MRSRTRSSLASEKEGKSPTQALSRGRKGGTATVAVPVVPSASTQDLTPFTFDIINDDDELAAPNPQAPRLTALIVSRKVLASDSSRTLASLSLRSIIGESQSPGPAADQQPTKPRRARSSDTSRKAAPRNLRSIMGTSESPPLPRPDAVDRVRPTLRRQALMRRSALKSNLPQQTPAAPAKSVTFGDDRMRGKVYSSTPRRFRQVYS